MPCGRNDLLKGAEFDAMLGVCWQNESDVLKWVIRKEFGELRRYIELEETGFMEMVENTASALIASIQTQVDDMSLVLGRFQEAESTLEGLSNESHLGFITKYGCIAPRFRECQQKQKREERTYSAITFKPGFNHSDIKMSVWKRLHRRVLPAVECGVLPNRLPNNPERFSYSYCVLASRGFSSGKHYWEVCVQGKLKWRLGLIKGTTSRKSKLVKSPESGVWLIGLKEGRLYEAFASPRVSLPLTAQPAKIGIFLNYEKGELTFYNADSPDELGFIYRYTVILFESADGVAQEL
ncbi:hypothetical protein JZ751_002083 [Albula glossodonta]|uniref:B30.2/SPRY domain-containing protein n=1 Tax=Albula glossodonta TaxID=121402 RepID=A0A8T2PFT7_9TELE|nr:hypothetical protein JZ751_002083 [Albula glossodonta]